MEIFNSIIDFFGFELLGSSATLIDFFNVVLKIGVAVFVVCFFIKSLFVMMSFITNYDVGMW